MEFSNLIVVFLSSISFVAGLIDSIAGGGGLLTMPALLFAGVTPQIALGTNKLCGGLGTLIAVLNFARRKMIKWPLILWGGSFTIIGGFLGSCFILTIDELLVGKIVVFLLPIATMSLFWKRKNNNSVTLSKDSKFSRIKVSLTCVTIGFYDGFFGPGTGVFLVLAFFPILHFDLVQATAHAKVFNFISNISAIAVFGLNQKLLLSLAIPMAFANMAGNFIGSQLVMKNGDGFVRKILLGSMLLLFISLTIKFFS
jgi:uncharacterized protein